jgi:hypothetical protein
MVAGVHVPLIPFDEVAGSAGAIEFCGSGPIAANKGVIELVITTSSVTGTAH